MNSFKFKSGILVAVMVTVSTLLATLVGCGGGGGGGSNVIVPPAVVPAPLSVDGKVIDGYVIGATVCLDLNDDRIFSADEPCKVTGIDGAFSFSGTGQHMLRSTGGFDSSTNAPFIGEMKAPSGATTVTLLSTLVVADVESKMPAPVTGTATKLTDSMLVVSETAVKSNLGIPASVALLTTDPVKEVQNNPGAAATKLMQQNVALQLLMQQTVTAVAAASGISSPTEAQRKAIYSEASKAIATLVAASTTATSAIDLSSAASSFTSTVVSNTVTQAKASDAVKATLSASAASNLAALMPESVAAVAAKTISDQVKAVADALATTLVAVASSSDAASNPALSAYKNTDMQVAIAHIAPLLTQTLTAVNTPTKLQSLANSVISTLSTSRLSDYAANQAASTVATIINQQINQTLIANPTAIIAQVEATVIKAAQTVANTAVTTSLEQATQLSVSPVTLSLDGINGTISSPATYNAADGGGRFNFTDSVTTSSFTFITNFGVNDSISITDAGSNHLIVANNGSDVVLTINANGTVSQITLVGVTSASAIIGTLSAFNALGLGQVTYK